MKIWCDWLQFRTSPCRGELSYYWFKWLWFAEVFASAPFDLQMLGTCQEVMRVHQALKSCKSTILLWNVPVLYAFVTCESEKNKGALQEIWNLLPFDKLGHKNIILTNISAACSAWSRRDGLVLCSFFMCMSWERKSQGITRLVLAQFQRRLAQGFPEWISTFGFG